MWPEKQGLICKRTRTCPGRNQNLFLLLKRVIIIPPYEGKCFFHCNKWIPLLVLNGSVNILLSLHRVCPQRSFFLRHLPLCHLFLAFQLTGKMKRYTDKIFLIGYSFVPNLCSVINLSHRCLLNDKSFFPYSSMNTSTASSPTTSCVAQ